MELETTSLGPCAACLSEKPWNTPGPKPKIIQAEAAILSVRDIYFKHAIQMHGLRQKLICLPDGTLIDGYTRFKILQELGMPILPYMIEIRDIPKDRIQEEVFDINIARRHLPDTKKIEWAQRYMPIFKEEPKRGRRKKTEMRSGTTPHLEGEGESTEPTDRHP
jgi:hypothetical protein